MLWSAILPTRPSTIYTLTYWMRTQNASRYPSVELFQYDVGSLQLSPSNLVYVNISGNTDWQQITYRFQTAPATSYARLRIHLNLSQTGTFWFDDFAIEEGAPALYPFQQGFPVKTEGWIIERYAPTVADLEGDGHNEVLAADHFGDVYAWDATGAPLYEYPLATGGVIQGHLALGDLNLNGDLEIVVGASSTVPGVGGQVFVWRPNGTLLTGWPKRVARYRDRDSKIKTVALADIDNDQDLEVIAGTNNNNLWDFDFDSSYVPNLYVWHHNGQLASGHWPLEDEFDAAIHGTLAVGDLDSDGWKDIVVGRDYHRLFAFDRHGNDLAGWPVTVYVPEDGIGWRDPRIEYKLSAPSLADLDRDGVVEYVVAGVRRAPGTGTKYNNDLLVLQPDGSRRPGWETPAGGAGLLSSEEDMLQAPAIGDLNGDYRFDIVVPTQDGWIRAYTADKTLLWAFNYAQGEFIYASEPVIGDIDDDGSNEVIFGTYDPTYGATGPVGLWILEHNGSIKAGSPLPVGTPGILPAPTLTDLDGDGDLDIVAATSVGMIYVWDTPSRYDPTRLPWPTGRHDIQRTAFLVADEPSLAASEKTASPRSADYGETIGYVVRLVRSGPPLTSTVYMTDIVPTGLSYLSNTLTATSGTVDDSMVPTLQWVGLLSDTNQVDITYFISVTEPSPMAIVNSVVISAGIAGRITRSTLVIVNGYEAYLPVAYR